MTKEEMINVVAGMGDAEVGTVEAIAEVARKTCMEILKEKDRALKLTDEGKKCYDYLAEQFILNYIRGKSLFDLIDDTMSDRFYNTWLGLLGMVKGIVKDGGKNRGIENIINNSGISRKTWIKFLDYYFQSR